MRVGVDMFLGFEQASVGFHLQAEVQVETLGFGGSYLIVLSIDGELRIVGVLDPTAGIFAVEFDIDVRANPLRIKVFYFPVFTGKINHGARTVVFGLHIESRHTGSICHFLIVCTESRSDMNNTGTVFGGNIITLNHAVGAFSGIDPREEGFILQADEVCTFVAGDDFCILEISTETCFGQNKMFLSDFNFHVINLRTYTKGRIRRESPGGCRPGDNVPTIFEVELSRTGKVLDIAVAAGLVQFVRTQSRSRCRRVRLNRISFI